MEIGFNSNLGKVQAFNSKNTTVGKTKEAGLVGFSAKLKDETPAQDEVSFKGTANEANELSKEDKQAIMKKARKTAAGWSILGNGLSTLYFGLRSDKTIAKKYNLDTEKDKDFIKEIKRQQTIQTIPSLLFNVGGIPAWIYNAIKNPNKLEV